MIEMHESYSTLQKFVFYNSIALKVDADQHLTVMDYK